MFKRHKDDDSLSTDLKAMAGLSPDVQKQALKTRIIITLIRYGILAVVIITCLIASIFSDHLHLHLDLL